MAKRFTDTEIWDQDWFIDLPNKYKLFWFFVKDKCDNAGFWRPNKGTFQKLIAEPVSLDEFIGFVNIGKERVKVLPTGRWFIKEFFVFQYGDKFSPTSPVHKGALKTLVQNGVHISEILNDGIGKLKDIDFKELKEIAYSKDINTLSIAYGNPIHRVKDKDMVKDKKKGGMGENEERAVQFSEDGSFAIFQDGEMQSLGQDQQRSLKDGVLQPHYVRKGKIE